MKPKSVAFNALFKASADGSCRSSRVECRGSRVDDPDPDPDSDPDPDLDETLKPETMKPRNLKP
jgi:hypothetical protein